jgi:glucosamine--fructose-6-phosphate aminotransferase (isomerizing)
MCGIVGYIGKQTAAPIILEGLRRLEYRGYDSAGMVVFDGQHAHTVKKKGKIDEGLAPALRAQPLIGNVGVGHTRWATHGPPSDVNAHPHLDQSGRIAVVHNGVIENFDRLKARLTAAGHHFLSDTDTEVLAHLIGEHYARLQKEPPDESIHILTRAVMAALREVIGTYGIVVLSADHPDVLVGARRGSPLIVGVGQGEHFLASDASAMVAHTRQVVYLNDYDVATISRDSFSVVNLGSDTAKVQISRIEFDLEAVEKGAYAHFMLKEIFEQPRTIENALRGRVDLEEATAKFGGLNMTVAELRAVDQMVLIACGICPSRSNTRANFATATPRSRKTPSCWPLPNPERPSIPSAVCANPAAAATRCSRFAMWSAAPSPVNPTAASTSMPGPRSAWPRPRPSRPR